MFILLDIDGVMVPAAAWKTPILLEDGFPVFTTKSIEALGSLLSPETTIILTTSHRNRFSAEEWKQIFAERGLLVNNLDRLPEWHLGDQKLSTIKDWVTTPNTDDDFLIIDDDRSLNELPLNIKEHLILTSPVVGLTKEVVEDWRRVHVALIS